MPLGIRVPENCIRLNIRMKYEMWDVNLLNHYHVKAGEIWKANYVVTIITGQKTAAATLLARWFSTWPWRNCVYVSVIKWHIDYRIEVLSLKSSQRHHVHMDQRAWRCDVIYEKGLVIFTHPLALFWHTGYLISVGCLCVLTVCMMSAMSRLPFQ